MHWIRHYLWRQRSFPQRVVIVGVLFVALNIALLPIAERKLDATQGGLYTLSEDTRRILAGLEKKIALTLYSSEKLVRTVPSYGNFERRTRAMLGEMARASRGNLQVRLVRPLPFSEAEDAALQARLQAVSIDQSGEQVFFGIVFTRAAEAESAQIESPLKQEVLPFLVLGRESALEYDIMRTLLDLSRDRKPRVALISPLEPLGSYSAALSARAATDAWAAFETLQEVVDLETVFVSEDYLDKDFDLTILLHPRIEDEELLYALEQNLLAGGRALLFLDPYYESTRRTSLNLPIALSSADFPLLESWGLAIDAERVLADGQYGTLVDSGEQGRVVPVPHLGWLQLEGEAFAEQAVELGDIKSLFLAEAGAIEVIPNEKEHATEITTRTLLLSSPESDLLSKSFFVSDPPDLLGAYEAFTPQGERHVLALAVEGRFTSKYTGVPEGMAYRAEHRAESSQPFRAIVVADADFLNDRYWVEKQNFLGSRVLTPFSDNGAMLVNIVESLARIDGLSALRSRGARDQPLLYLERLRLKAEGKWRLEQQALNDKLAEIESSLESLRSSKEESEEQEQAMQSVTEQLVETRRALRDVQRALNQEVSAVQRLVQGVNALLMPFCVCVIALVRRRTLHRSSVRTM